MAGTVESGADVRDRGTRSPNREERLQSRGAESALGPSGCPVPPEGERYVSGDRSHLRRARRGQGRDREPAERVDGPAPYPHARLRHALGRRERSPADVALLARAAAEGKDRDLLRILVHGADHRPRLPKHGPRRPRAVDRGDQPLREDARRRGRAGSQVLVSPVPRGAAGTPEGPPVRSRDALARDQTRQGLFQGIRPLLQDLRRNAARDQHGGRAVDRGRGRGPAVPVSHGRQGAARGDEETPRRAGPARPSGCESTFDRPRDRQAGRAHGARPDQDPHREGVQERAARLAGPPQPPHARREVPAAFRHPGVRRHGRGGQGRHDPPRHGRRSTRATTT